MDLKAKLAALPDKPGCYLFRDRNGKIIYVGKAVSLRRRVQSYFRASTLRSAAPKLRSLIHHTADLDIMIVRSEAEALLTEGNLIKQYRPRFNVLLRDDKNYPALKAERGEVFPRIVFSRIVREDGAEYFGPFPSDGVVRTALDFVQKRFGLRKCRPLAPDAETHRHCHDDVLRFCCAPCIGKVSAEEYGARFAEACAFLRGERLAILQEVKEQMQTAAQAQNFEKAAVLRDTWLALNELVRRRRGSCSSPKSCGPPRRPAWRNSAAFCNCRKPRPCSSASTFPRFSAVTPSRARCVPWTAFPTNAATGGSASKDSKEPTIPAPSRKSWGAATAKG